MTVGSALINRRLAEFERALISLHDVDNPDASGSGELSGGKYARQQPPTWQRIAPNATRTTSDVLFAGLPLAQVRAVGFWSPDGEFLESRPVQRRDSYAGDDYRIPAGSITIYELEVEG